MNAIGILNAVCDGEVYGKDTENKRYEFKHKHIVTHSLIYGVTMLKNCDPSWNENFHGFHNMKPNELQLTFDRSRVESILDF